MRLYRWLIARCSTSFQREYAVAMEETFARRLEDARAAGRWRTIRLWRRELASLLLLAIADRYRARGKVRGERKHVRRHKAGPMTDIGLDIRQAARRLWWSPAFSIPAVLTLALAIAANAAIFTVVYRVVVNPLPYPDSDRLIDLDHGAHRLKVSSGLGMTYGLYFHYAGRTGTVEHMAIHRTEDLTLLGAAAAERIRVARVTPSLERVLRVSPALGRWFTDAEGAPGTARVAILSHGFWMRRYGGDRGMLGRAITLDGVPTEVIGVMPASFAFPDPRVEAWVTEPLTRDLGFGLWGYGGVARLRGGATIDDARTELTGLIPDVVNTYPADPRAAGNADSLFFAGRTLKDATVGRAAQALWILLASVGLVLLVACANVANLFLVRSEERQREVAVRRALGAGRFGMARYFLTESVLLAVAGGTIGVALAAGAVRLVVGFGPANLPRLTEIRVDAVTLLFTFVVSMVAALLFGAIPLLRSRDMTAALQESGRGNTASRGRHRARHLLMGAQVALALVLLVSSGLMVRSFQKLRAVNPGYDASSALTFSVGLPEREYSTQQAAIAAHHAIIERLQTLPGVERVSATSCLPLSAACYGNTLRVEGRPWDSNTIPPIAVFRAVAGGYFEAMVMPILRGRALDRSDVDRKERVAVVSNALAKRYFPDQDPIGRRIASNRPPKAPGLDAELIWLTIVGIVPDSPTGRVLPEPNPLPQVFMPLSIAGGPGIPRNALIGPDISVMSYVVRTATPPLDVLESVRSAITAFDVNLPLAQVGTLQDTLDRASAQMAFTMILLVIASGVALLLGTIGIYGVMSYVVAQRTGEIGVRLALGANPAGVAGEIIRQGGVVTLAGIVAGLGAALAGGRLIESLLYGVSARDPIVMTATTLVLLTVALIACWLPARRAARLSPVDALRS